MCSEESDADASWCEACGADLDAPTLGPPCVDCGAPEGSIGADGYCGRCGRKQPDPRDHFEFDLGWVAAVTSKGMRHHHNEDAVAVAALGDAASGASSVLVVCDGVGSTVLSEAASQAAADAALEVLVEAASTNADLAEAMEQACVSAQEAVLRIPVPEGSVHPPSTTFVAAVTRIDGDTVRSTVAWLGDSRAYWLGADLAQLSLDDAWGREQVAAGAMTAEEVAAAPTANSITRWLGRDALDVTPTVVHHETTAPGRIVLCSDGLWNYAADPIVLQELVGQLGDGSTVELAQGLVAFANASGGHDNITVAIAACGTKE